MKPGVVPLSMSWIDALMVAATSSSSTSAIHSSRRGVRGCGSSADTTKATGRQPSLGFFGAAVIPPDTAVGSRDAALLGVEGRPHVLVAEEGLDLRKRGACVDEQGGVGDPM